MKILNAILYGKHFIMAPFKGQKPFFNTFSSLRHKTDTINNTWEVHRVVLKLF